MNTGYYTPEDSVQIVALLDSSRDAYLHNLEQSLSYGYEALELAEAGSNQLLISKVLDHLGVVYSRMGEGELAIEKLERSLEINKAVNDDRSIVSNLVNISSIYKRESNYARALDYLFESLRLSEEINFVNAIAVISNNIGLNYHELGDYERALKYYYRAEEANSETNNLYLRSIIYNNIGLTLSDLEKFDESLEYHFKSIEIKEENDNSIGIAYSLNNIGKVHYLSGNYEIAEGFLKQAITVNNGQDRDILSVIYENLAKVYIDTGQFNTAKDYAIQSLELAREFGSLLGQQEGYRLLSEIYSQTEDFESAFIAQKNLGEIRDSILNEEVKKHSEELQAMYETEKRETEIALLEKKNLQASWLRNVLTGGVFVLILIGILVYNRQKLKIKNNKTELENRRLKEEQLKRQLNFKNKQLTTYSLNLAQKNEIMRELKEKIHNMNNQHTAGSSQNIMKLNHLVDYSFNLDEDWEKFKMFFEEVHTGFFDLLKERYPELTPNELRLSALVKLNLSIKETASLLGISPSSVKTARYRLRKKLELETRQKLTDFLMNIEEEAIRQ